MEELNFQYEGISDADLGITPIWNDFLNSNSNSSVADLQKTVFSPVKATQCFLQKSPVFVVTSQKKGSDILAMAAACVNDNGSDDINDDVTMSNFLSDSTINIDSTVTPSMNDDVSSAVDGMADFTFVEAARQSADDILGHMAGGFTLPAAADQSLPSDLDDLQLAPAQNQLLVSPSDDVTADTAPDKTVTIQDVSEELDKWVNQNMNTINWKVLLEPINVAVDHNYSASRPAPKEVSPSSDYYSAEVTSPDFEPDAQSISNDKKVKHGALLSFLKSDSGSTASTACSSRSSSSLTGCFRSSASTASSSRSLAGCFRSSKKVGNIIERAIRYQNKVAAAYLNKYNMHLPNILSHHRKQEDDAAAAVASLCVNDVIQRRTDNGTPTYITLIGKALLASPDYTLALRDIYKYVAESVPDLTLRSKNWQSTTRSFLAQSGIALVIVNMTIYKSSQFTAIIIHNYHL